MKHGQRGFTLVELMIASGVLVIMIGMIYTVNLSMVRLARTQDAQITMMEEGRNAMRVMTQNLRMSGYDFMWSMDGGAPETLSQGVEVHSLRYQRPDDLDGNGTIVDVNMDLELRPPRTFQVDTDDANGDGRTDTQLVELDENGNVIRVLANNISPAVAPQGGAGHYDATAGGLIFTRLTQTADDDNPENAIQITLIMRRLSMAGGATIVARLDGVVVPKNNGMGNN